MTENWGNTGIKAFKSLPFTNTTKWAGFGGQQEYIDGVGNAAKFNDITCLAVDADNNLFVCDPPTIRRVSASAVVTTLTGASTALLGMTLAGIATDASGNLYVSDTSNHRILRVTASMQ